MDLCIFQMFLANQLGREDDIHGCSPEEIAALESECRVQLPDDYRAFLLRAGRGASELWRGYRYTIERLPRMQQYCPELFVNARVPVPDNSFFFLLGQGVHCYFFNPSGVFSFAEHQDQYEKVADSFAEFLVATNHFGP